MSKVAHWKFALICLLFIFCLVFSGSTLAAEIPFAAQISISTAASQAQQVVSADMDEDGDMDTLSASYADDTIAWYENSAGSGTTWTEHLVSNLAQGARSLTTADVDGDGDLDILSAAASNDLIAWYENLGGGDFGSPVSNQQTISDSVPGAVFVVAADVDGDGDMDAVSAGNTAVVGVRWHENNAGDGSSWSSHTIALAPALTAVYSVQLADVDGDGDVDVLSADPVADQLLWHENSAGDGSLWTTHTISSSVNGAWAVAASDMDQDGDMDAVAGLDSGNGAIWYENSTGNGTTWVSHLITTSGCVRSLSLADMDWDGDVDVATADFCGSFVRWYENGGDSLIWIERTIQVVHAATSVFLADVDSDGDWDTLSSSETDNTIAWHENETTHRSAYYPVQGTAVSAFYMNPGGVQTADLDRDGALDVVTFSANNQVINWLHNSNQDGTAWGDNAIDSDISGLSATAVADLNSDGFTDVLFVSASAATRIGWYENDHTPLNGGWVSHVVETALDAGSVLAVNLADLDHDGDLDVLAALVVDEIVGWYANDGAGNFGSLQIVASDVANLRDVYSGDLDGDGRLDVLSAASTGLTPPNDGSEIAWYRNLGSGLFAPQQVISTAAIGARQVRAADMDSDGDTDVLAAMELAGLTGYGVAWYANSGNGTFGPQQGIVTMGYGCTDGLETADLDHDGDLDVLTNDHCTGVPIEFENSNGIGTVWLWDTIQFPPFVYSYTAVTAGDMNGDGNLDILAADATGNLIHWFPNQGGQFVMTTTNTAPATLEEGQTDDILKTRVTHRGRTGDSAIELATFQLLFEQSAGDPLTTAEANALIDSVAVYRDNGSGSFEVGSDFLAASVSTLSLSGGVQTVNFTDGDFQARVTVATHQTYFAAVQLTSNAASQFPNQFRLTFLAADGVVEDRTYDLPLLQEYPINIASTVVTAVSSGGGPFFTVNSSDDNNDGTCDPTHCSLREAINTANSNVGSNTISFNIPGAGPHTILLSSPLPALLETAVVDGASQPGYEGLPLIVVDGSIADNGNGLTLTGSNSQVTGLSITNFIGHGIVVTGGATGVTLRQNLIAGNSGLGIDLDEDGVTANDVNDVDGGSNDGQNFPVILSAIPNGISTAIQTRLNSTPSTSFVVDFYLNGACDSSEYGEGETYLGSTTADTDSSGNVTFTYTVFSNLPLGQFITAIATDINTGSTSEFSRCVVTGLGNTSWLTAYELPLSGDVEVPTVVNHFIDAPDQSRWYKFSVDPDSQAFIELTNLPANYDVTVYRDIGQAFQEEISGTQDLVLLSAEFAPDIFNPDIFNPDIFNPDIFNPDIFNPDIFNPDIFNPDIFNPDIFNPDIFNPDIFNADNLSPDIFNPDIFNPDIFNPDIFNPDIFNEAFSSAQLRSAVAVSGKEGLADELVTVNTWNNEGFYYVRVRGRNGTFDVANPFQLSVAVNGGACAGLSDSGLPPTSLTAVSNDYTSLILTDQGQLEALYGPTAADDLLTLLETLALRPEVNGVVVNVGADDRVAAARDLLNDYLACPAAQNILADAIKTAVDVYWQANPNLQYLVLVGNDQVIPFYRYPDQALLAPESNYVVPVLEGSLSDASLELNYLLSQDQYGSQVTVSTQSSELPVPELGIGRLVETPSDMTAVLTAYLATSDGVMAPTTSLVTGYDFLEDAALAVETELRLGTGVVPDQLITPQTVAPENAWTADQLRTLLLQSGRHDLVYMAGHFSAGGTLAADYKSRLLASEVANSAVDMSNSLIFSAGCHAGYNIVNSDGIPLLTPEPDWAQAFAQKGATLVAGTGYQYGDSDFIEYGERLYLLFSQQLRTGTEPVAVGQALAAAKQAYLADVGAETNGIYQKQMLIATLFGLPMLRVDMPGQHILLAEDPSIVINTNGYVDPGPGQTLGLQFADVTITPTLTLITQTLVNVNNVNEAITVSYLAGGSDEQVLVNPAEPVLPLQTFNVSVPGQVLRGVGFRSGQYSGLEEIRPLAAAATYDLSGPRPIFASDFLYPSKLWNVNYYGALIDPNEGVTQLNLTPAQFQSDGPASTTGTLRQFNQMQFRLFYSNNTNTYSGNTPYLSNPPALSQVLATVNGAEVDFVVRAVGDPSAGVQEVWITWSDGTQVNGVWQSLDLVQDAADSTLWQGSLTAVALNGTLPENVRYMVQAVNGVGLVTLATNVGRFYEPGVDPGDPTQGNGAVTELLFENPPSSAAYGEMLQLSAVLSSDGVPLPDQLVRFTLGTERTAVTDQNGRATLSLPISAVPGVYQLTATFAGTADYQPATDSLPFTVTKQTVTLTLSPTFNSILPGEDSEMVATLRDPDDNALIQKPILLVVDGPEGSFVLLGVTNFLGQLSLGPVTLPPGSYTVTAHFGDSFTLPDNTPVDLTDNNYAAATAVATLVIEGDDHEILYISLSTSGSVAGIAYSDEDILAYDTVADSWSLYFDGSDVGLAPRDLDAFAIAEDGTILLSVASPLPLVDVGWVDDSDIVRFIPTTLGDNTSGTFEMYLDASDVGLTTLDEDIDALDFAPDGRLLVSTVGPFSVVGAFGTDADLIAFTATSLGQNSAGTWEFYFDGSDVGLTTDKEDIWGVWTDEANGEIYLTTKSKFTVPGLDGGAEDIFICTPVTLGNTTRCTFSLYWDGSAYGFARKQVDDFAIVR